MQVKIICIGFQFKSRLNDQVPIYGKIMLN